MHCDLCPPECTEPSCPIPEFTPECTDQCLVLACDDPDHGAQTCLVTDGDTACDGTCITAAACSDCPSLDEILQCCTDYHSYLAPWELHCDCTQPVYPTPSIQALVSDASIPSSASSSPSLSPFSPQLHAPSAIALQSSFPCMWADCGAAFAGLSELVGHVNLQHLCSMDSASLPLGNPHVFAPPPLSCHWGDCAMFPSPSSIPSSSSTTSNQDAINVLVTHLMHDHLGLSLPVSSPQVHSEDSPHHSPAPSGPSPHDCSGIHLCRWKACTQSFTTCDDLTSHIASVHIGGGKAHYECFWQDCNRNGTNGFSSKQKISRHLQSHTGHRPFQCEVCNQNFSEAATLQQHKRRHTREKPYVCDFPGCKKAFAITGALTIHKRTHNGLRPFKCKFCDKAFSESSNLSKHQRTHTGVRPYVCTEQGCSKAFARPDQLARHMNVHRKKVAKG